MSPSHLLSNPFNILRRGLILLVATISLGLAVSQPARAQTTPEALSAPFLNNAPAGSLPGGLEVSRNGSATYHIPFALPPGTPGMQPSLSISYNSDNANGAAGLGWSIGGFSNINRCRRVVAINAKTDAVRMLKSDRLCLDGTQLILVNGDTSDDNAYWADSAEYRTEIESFARITAKIVNGGYRFTVEHSNGNKSFYGETDDSTVGNPWLGGVHRWRISRQIDLSSNYISYFYRKNSGTGESKPSEIRWGGNEAAAKPHHAKVILAHNERPDVRNSFTAGGPEYEELRLEYIHTYSDILPAGSGGTLANQYWLTYELSPTSGRSMLKSIKACDGGNVCLPQTTFEWGRPDPAAPKNFVFLGGERTGPNLSTLKVGADNALDSVVMADFNGDGKQDMLERRRTAANNNQQRLYLSNADGTNWTVTTPLSQIAGSGLVILGTMDFWSNGGVDLLVADMPPGQVVPSNFRLCRWYSGVFACPENFTLPADAFSATKVPDRFHVIRDVDGDGRDDLILTGYTQEPGNMGPIYLCLTRNAGFTCTQTNGSEIFPTSRDARVTVALESADVNGDGRADFVRLNKCIQTIPNTPNWYCGEGYGLAITGATDPDVPPYSASNWAPLRTAAPSGLLSPPPTGTISGDLNNDGYPDLVFGTVNLDSTTGQPTSFKGNVCFGTGGPNSNCKQLPTSPVQNHLVITVADIDGDGMPDVLRPHNNTWNDSAAWEYQVCRVTMGYGEPSEVCTYWNAPPFYSQNRSLAFAGTENEKDASLQRSLVVGDLDGDGRQDFATYMGGTYKTGDKWQVWRPANQAKSGEALDKLVSATNGHGRTDRVTYSIGNDPTVYTKVVLQYLGGVETPPSPTKRTSNSRAIVKRLDRGMGSGGNASTTYSYAGNAYDGAGRGGMGFARMDTTDVATNVTNTNWYYQSYPFIGAMRFSETRTPTCVLSRTENGFAVNNINHGVSNVTTHPFLSPSTVTRRDLNCADLGNVVTTLSYLDSGNLIKKEETTNLNGTYKATTEATYTNFETPTRWQFGLANEVKFTKTTPDAISIRKDAFTYDAKGLLLSRTNDPGDPALSITTTYNRSGNSFGLVNSTKIAWRDPISGADLERTVSQVGYDALGRFAISQKNALGHTETREFDARNGAVTRVISADSQVTNYTNDGFGRRIKSVAPDGNESHNIERVCGTSCPSGATSVAVQEQRRGAAHIAPPILTYRDSASQAVRTDSIGFDGTNVVSQLSEYDNKGRVSRISRAYNTGEAVLWSTMSYDHFGRVTKVTGPDGGTFGTAYNGLTTTATNQLGQTLTSTADGWGRTVSVIDAANSILTYKYDALGNVTKTTDPKGNIVTSTYDALGRKTSIVDPDMGSWTYLVDPLGQVRRQTNGKNQVVTSSYDAIGRQVNRTEPDLKSDWIYDACLNGVGKLCRSTSDNGYVYAPTYNSFGRPSTTSTTIDAVYGTALTYDANGRIATQSYPTGLAVRYIYTALGYLKEVRNIATDALYWRADARDAEGRLLQQTHGNGVVTQQIFDPATGRLKAVYAGAGNAVQNLTLTYDARGNVLTRADANQNLNESFLYDSLSRLTSSTVNSSGAGVITQTYVYDNLGNITSRSGVGTYTYGPPNSKPHAVAGIELAGGGTRQYTYDVTGNLTDETQRDASNNIIPAKGRISTYTSFNMPISLATPAATLTFTYGPEHQRTKQVAPSGTTIYLHPNNSGGLAFEKETKTDGTVTHKHFVTAGDSVVAILQQVGSAITPLYLHRDNLGSTTAITNAVGDVIERFAYEPFGKRRTPLGAVDTSGSLAGINSDRGFSNHEHLDELGLIHMNGRVYDPVIARFMSADPGVPYPTNIQSYNRYSYTRNNPLASIDPSGFNELDDALDALIAEALAKMIGELTGTINPKFGDFPELSDKSGAFNTLRSDEIVEQKDTAGKVTQIPVVEVHGQAPGKLTPAEEEVTNLLLIAANGIPFERPLMGAYDAYKAARGVNACCCFPAGTSVAVEGGEVAIETVEVGQLVYARDEKTGVTALKPVTAVMVTPGKPLYEVTTESKNGLIQRLEVTDNHPFWVKGKGWVDSAQLQLGMKLPTLDEQEVTVISLKSLKKVEITYNFTVEDFHTYFAGEQKAFVHNCACAVKLLSSFKDAATYGIQKYKDFTGLGPLGLQAHHLIPQRFAVQMGQTVGDMLSIVLTRAEHQPFTNAWRNAISHGEGTATATRETIEAAARQIYADYPELLKALGL
jgi:RHS repeat-associated protein